MKWFTTGLLIIYCLAALPQRYTKGHLDSLLKKYITLSPGPAKFNAELQLFRYYLNSDPSKALKLANAALSEAERLKNDTDICLFTDCIGEVYCYRADNQQAMNYLNKDYELAKKKNLKWQMALALTDMSSVYQNQSDYINSEAYSLRSLAIYEELKDFRQIAICNYNIGVTFNNNNDFKKAIIYGKKVLELESRIDKNDVVIPNAYLLIGSAWASLNNYNEARKYYQSALKIYETDKNDFGKASILSQLVATYPGNYSKQIDLGLQAQQLWNKLSPDNFYSVYNLGALGFAYGNMAIHSAASTKRGELFSQSQLYFANALQLAKKTNNKSAIIDITDSLSIINAAMGDYKAAYNNLKLSSKLYDSVYSQDNKNKIAALESAREIATRDKQLMINKLQIAAANRQKWGLTAGLLTLLVIASLVYYQSLQRRRSNTKLQQLNDQLSQLNNELDEANKVKIRFFSILNHDLKTPIAGFINFLHLKRNDPDLVDAETSEAYSQKAIAAAENLLIMMEDLLLWSKGQMENFKPVIREIAVNELFSYLRLNVATGNVIIKFDAPDHMYIKTDEYCFKTIMYNLTTNAVKALETLPDGQIEWKAWQEDRKSIFSITNNGPEVDERTFVALYDYKAPVGIKSGLGLHIIRDLAKVISCRIDISNKKKSGVEIKIILEDSIN